jgi:hypothetical protein
MRVALLTCREGCMTRILIADPMVFDGIASDARRVAVTLTDGNAARLTPNQPNSP